MTSQDKKAGYFEMGDMMSDPYRTSSYPLTQPKVPRPDPVPAFASPRKPRTYIFVSSYLGKTLRFEAKSDGEAKELVRKQYSKCPGKSGLYRLEEIPLPVKDNASVYLSSSHLKDDLEDDKSVKGR